MTLSKEEFVKHACEQVLRFTRVKNWHDLSEELKVQLGFNVGAMALGLGLSKEDGFLALSNARKGIISMEDFHKHVRGITVFYGVEVDEEMVRQGF